MSWLGKILTFVVLVGALVGVFFTTQSFVTRTNWKKDRDDYKAAYEKAINAQAAETLRHQATEESTKRLLSKQEKLAGDRAEQVETLTKASNKYASEFKVLQDQYNDADSKHTERQAKVDRTLKELDIVRARKEVLEDTQSSLRLEIENAKKEEVRARNAAKLAQGIAEDFAKKIEELSQKNAELRASGGGSASPLKQFDKLPPPVLANLRGEVERVAGDQVQISLGIDAGLAVGTVLDVIRMEGGRGTFVGTVKVTSVQGLYPKVAIVTFTPLRKVPLERLRPEELPRKDDVVRPADAGTR